MLFLGSLVFHDLMGAVQFPVPFKDHQQIGVCISLLLPGDQDIVPVKIRAVIFVPETGTGEKHLADAFHLILEFVLVTDNRHSSSFPNTD